VTVDRLMLDWLIEQYKSRAKTQNRRCGDLFKTMAAETVAALEELKRLREDAPARIPLEGIVR